MKLHSFVFNDFEENTYLLYDGEGSDCIIIDPGNNGTAENGELMAFITKHQLKVNRLINTHCHIDHVLGNAWVNKQFDVYPEAHRGEIPVLESCERVAQMYGIPYIPSPPSPPFYRKEIPLLWVIRSWKYCFVPATLPPAFAFIGGMENCSLQAMYCFTEA